MATFMDDISGKKWLDINVISSTITTVLIQLSYKCYCSCGTDILVYTCVYWCIPMYTDVYPCILMNTVYTGIYPFMPLYTRVYPCIMVHTRVYRHHTGVYLCILVYTCVYPFILMYTGVYLCILVQSSN